MVLSDVDIKNFLEDGELVVDPIGDLGEQLQPCSLDLRLADDFKIMRKPDGVSGRLSGGDWDHPCTRTKIAELDIRRGDNPDNYFWEGYARKENEPFVLYPGTFVLGRTIEYVSLPANLLGRLDGRSSVGRLGLLVHATAGFIDPGFHGTITLELANLSPVSIALYPGMRICQISFEVLLTPSVRPYGSERGSKYQNQVEATPSRIGLDAV